MFDDRADGVAQDSFSPFSRASDRGMMGSENVAGWVPLDAKCFANLLLDWADGLGTPITPMKLQKLIYYCHADFLVTHSLALLANDFEAWEHGPVIPTLFREFRDAKAAPIYVRAKRFNPVTAVTETAPPATLGPYQFQVKDIFDSYVHLSASTLRQMSHVEHGAWSAALFLFEQGRNMDRRITNDLIQTHHRPNKTSAMH